MTWLVLAVFVLLGCNQASHSYAGGASALQGDDAGSCVPNTPPTLTPRTTQLWPPNHKFHAISVDDCVTAVDACGTPLQGEFIWGSSDEPVDDLGDGHFAPDLLFGDCQHVDVRAERQGPKEGRVYKLGVRVVDASGNASESECMIIVDHDQRGVQGADSGESYRVRLDGSAGQLTCDGLVDVPDAGSNPPDSAPIAGEGAPPPVTGGGDAGDNPPESEPTAGEGAPPPVVIVDAGMPS